MSLLEGSVPDGETAVAPMSGMRGAFVPVAFNTGVYVCSRGPHLYMFCSITSSDPKDVFLILF